ncbi:syntaxin-12-like isoform X2 [Anopheles albimanus]|uniref:syntaxin-12-like isoform X2 n=1 Tax=Anopheles albimanus TaxID=7167 RepID=UPI0016402888|nr:syntaxin-12-like isoform X2 [Anopheles albimanus]
MLRDGKRFGPPRGIGQQTYGAIGSTVGPSTGTSFAGDGQTEFTSLSAMIAANTLQVRQSWQYLKKVTPLIGTPKDTQSLRYKIHDNRKETNQRIRMTTQELVHLKSLVPGGDKEKRLQAELLQSKFTEVEQAYATSQQNIADKMKRVLPVNEIMEVQASDDGGNNTDDSRSELLQIQINRDLHLEHKRLVEREQEILDIETTVVDVNHIMRDLSNLVNHQSEGIDSIENSITVAAENVEKGTDELGKAATYQNKYRSKVLILLIIAVILAFIITAIIIWKLKS